MITTTTETTATTTYLADILLLCTQCQQPIRARINTCNWIRAEWIGPSGECLKCYQAAKVVTVGDFGVQDKKQNHADPS